MTSQQYANIIKFSFINPKNAACELKNQYYAFNKLDVNEVKRRVPSIDMSKCMSRGELANLKHKSITKDMDFTSSDILNFRRKVTSPSFKRMGREYINSIYYKPGPMLESHVDVNSVSFVNKPTSKSFV